MDEGDEPRSVRPHLSRGARYHDQLRAQSAFVLGLGLLGGASECSLATTFAGYVGDPVAADAALVDGSPPDDAADASGAADAAVKVDAGGDGAVTICRPGFTGRTLQQSRLGVPVSFTLNAPVSNVVVYAFSSNQKSILAKTGGHIQLWSNCYDPDVNSGTFDGLDAIQANMPSCYGTMQLNVDGAPVLGLHRWAAGSGTDFDVGIGPCPVAKHPDWTFAANAAQYKTRRLEVYAR